MASYKIVAGDTLGAIAKRLGTSVAKLLELNPSITDANKISTGATITIPGATTTTTTTATTAPTPSTGTNPNRPPPTVRNEYKPGSDIGGVGTGPTSKITLNSIGGKPEVWKNSQTGENFLVYFVPDSKPPIPLIYSFTDAELKTAFGTQAIVYDRQLTSAQIKSYGSIDAGTASEVPTEGDPFEQWYSLVTAQAAVRPWLREKDVLALIAEATLEGRIVSQGEFEQTSWWKTHNQSQRQWLLTIEADPKEAQRLISDNQAAVRDLLLNAGVNNASAELVNFIANKWVTGDWSKTYANNQIRALADPYSKIAVDDSLKAVMGNTKLDTTQAMETDVRDRVLQWLGPVHGKWSQSQIAQWAGTLRNDPDGETKLLAMLKGQRMALYPTYTNENLTYNDIAAPWKGRMSSIWGRTVDDADPVLDKMIRQNDLETNDALLRSEGLNRNIGAVKTGVQEAMLQSFGTVRKAI